MDNKQLTVLKSIIDNYEILKEKIFRVLEIVNGPIGQVLKYSLNDNGNFEVSYEYYCGCEYDTSYEWFPVDLLDKNRKEIYEYFHERREKELEAKIRKAKAAERREKAQLRKKELAELARLKEKYES